MEVRIGIDVGGTFTKAVAIDNTSLAIVGKASTMTTHRAAEGVAAGVIQVFHDVLAQTHIEPREVRFVAHSTTQATNALLEGDVAPVGILGMGGSWLQSWLARRQTRIGDIQLAPGKVLPTFHAYLRAADLTPDAVRQTLEGLTRQGARVIVASEAFGVDSSANERLVTGVAETLGLPACGGSAITKLYGLTVRTRTAVVNASILPKMMETADMTERSVRSAHIEAPLMIMRGDGGLMDVAEMRKRPIVTMLSGPAASVAGALMYLRVSDGIFFEVGGTSTNIGVIKNGRPMVKYVDLGGHRTFLNSLDVRVLGVAGGSMPRLADGRLVDVGPRSAHIAGLPYAAFADPEELRGCELILVRPRPADPEDYAAVRTRAGKAYAITNTCAANVLGLAQPGHYAYGNPAAAREAVGALANRLGQPVEAVARHILEIPSAKIVTVLETLIAEYQLERQGVVLVGGGGGAAALIPFTAQVLGLEYQIAKNAEVISSIGVALSMIRDIVERTIPNPRPEDIAAIKQEAVEAAVRVGAAPESVQVYIEVDTQKSRVRATALGTTELKARDLLKTVGEAEAAAIATQSMRADPATVRLLGQTETLRVYEGQLQRREWGVFRRTRRPIRVVDHQGFVKLQREVALVEQTTVAAWAEAFRALWQKGTVYVGDATVYPDMFLLVGSRLVDLSGMQKLEQAQEVARTETVGHPETETVVLIAGMRDGM
ncbi:MAG: hydantoinase/oxoprolinase family protein [Candidatus Methylomirabilota bacterium]|jgi:N-methylhydantoinase A/oxoprolinase/acetone carboxylase beta subunit